jgi:hypothetical protein
LCRTLRVVPVYIRDRFSSKEIQIMSSGSHLFPSGWVNKPTVIQGVIEEAGHNWNFLIPITVAIFDLLTQVYL